MTSNPMTKHRLEQYRTLRREIEMLEKQIESETSSGNIVTDTVRGSSQEHPYTQRNIVITGYGESRAKALSARKADKDAEREAIEQFVDSIDDSIIWQMLTLRYIEGKTLRETADLVGYSTNHAGVLINDFFKKTMRHHD